MRPITVPDTEIITQAAADRDPRRNHNLYDLLPADERSPEFRSVFIDSAWQAGIEEYDGALHDAYVDKGTAEVSDVILRYLAAVVPALKAVDPDFFDARIDYSYFEVTFYTHPSGYHQTSAIFFDPNGTEATTIR
jgi:hypothetical protein